MVRHEKELGPLHIAWGHDEPLNGYFLTLTDKSLAWRWGQSSEVDNIVYKVSGSGGGHYLGLNSYTFPGIGYRVSEATIFTFMRRYGIDPGKIFTENAVGSEEDLKTCANRQCGVREILAFECANGPSLFDSNREGSQ
ncbi:hypothetical protein DFQ27_000154 [Actinomortierella ambigua]|uniref:Uncharacterized protein n=1 Tax=Actinomortierella ambigua TaxID=1343610 RepID=A0A9P6QH29_9FUNG|nr:hypothetical protein DFQ27_000154 [Actinomortierella ambigua]